MLLWLACVGVPSQVVPGLPLGLLDLGWLGLSCRDRLLPFVTSVEGTAGRHSRSGLFGLLVGRIARGFVGFALGTVREDPDGVRLFVE